MVQKVLLRGFWRALIRLFLGHSGSRYFAEGIIDCVCDNNNDNVASLIALHSFCTVLCPFCRRVGFHNVFEVLAPVIFFYRSFVLLFWEIAWCRENTFVCEVL